MKKRKKAQTDKLRGLAQDAGITKVFYKQK